MSELVTNAVRYGLRTGLPRSAPDARLELVLMRRAGCLVCVVTDANPGPPVLMEPDCAAETGRGLCVVGSLSKQWGWTPLSITAQGGLGGACPSCQKPASRRLHRGPPRP